jgi:hypothetical protein
MEFRVEPSPARGWLVLTDRGAVLSRHQTQQQAFDAAKRRASRSGARVLLRDAAGRRLGSVDYAMGP